jgi:hypothetical protein
MREGHRAEQKVDALIELITDDGQSPPGQLPPSDYVEAVREAPDGRADEIRAAHAERRGPPDFAGGGQRG